MKSDEIRIKERLNDEPLLDQTVRQGKQHDGHPTVSATSRDFAHENRTTAIHWAHEQKGKKRTHRDVAQQIFGNERRHEEQHKRRCYAAETARRGRNGLIGGCFHNKIPGDQVVRSWVSLETQPRLIGAPGSFRVASSKIV